VLDHLAAIERNYHSMIRESIEEQITFTPLSQTRNRKPLSQPAPFNATWELRFGRDNQFRVFYEVDDTAMIVSILAIGIKEGSKLRIGREEIEV
jgi:mRNA-degrading endonuclease RelE of RelBE toxin-antitoxin system